MASVPALVIFSDAVNEIAGCVPSALEGTQPRHTPPPSSKNVLSKATVRPVRRVIGQRRCRGAAPCRRNRHRHRACSCAPCADNASRLGGRPLVRERSVSTTIELFARRRRHPEVEMLACASEKRWRAMALVWFVARRLTAGKGTSTAGVAQSGDGHAGGKRAAERGNGQKVL